MLSMTLLYNHGPDCAGDHGLHEAINHQHLGALTFLLACGKDLEDPCHGTRPLMRAVCSSVQTGDVGYQMTELLLRHGALANVRTETADLQTPLHHAAARGHAGIADLLLMHAANPNLRDANGRTALHASCLQWVAFHEDSVVELLLDHGADPRLRDLAGVRPREHLARAGGRTEVCRRLLREELWLERGPAILARGRGTSRHPLCRLPDLLFEAVVRFLG